MCADLKTALGEADPENPATLFRLTSHQRSIVQRLLDKHGSDLQVLPERMSSPGPALLLDCLRPLEDGHRRILHSQLAAVEP